MKQKIYTAIGLMSGTSLDGVDVALLKTDGYDFAQPLAFYSMPYAEDIRTQIRRCFGHENRYAPECVAAEQSLTMAHVEAVRAFMQQQNISAQSIDLIGFHGQTIQHNPDAGQTVQLGDGAMMAQALGIDTICDFRTADMRAGGQGAPLLPLYHRARAAAGDLPQPLAILNIGGVANVTYIGGQWTVDGERLADQLNTENRPPNVAHRPPILAFDTGAGCALIDDFMRVHTDRIYDEDGRLAFEGTPDFDVLNKVMTLPFFDAVPPKSLDRETFKKPPALRGAGLFQAFEHLSTADGVATLSEFTVQGVLKAVDFLPDVPKLWLVTGGGRLNEYIMARLRSSLGVAVQKVESAGWNGDAVEAEGFAYLAVRSLLGLPLSLPTTTGAREPVTGGVLHAAKGKKQGASI